LRRGRGRGGERGLEWLGRSGVGERKNPQSNLKNMLHSLQIAF